MSATPTRPDLPQFALELARARAKSLARQKRLPAHEHEDIEQHFLVELRRRWHRLDEERRRSAGFVVRVIDNAGPRILIKREAAPSRGGSLRFISLEGQVGTDGAVAEVVGICGWRNLRLVQAARTGVGAPAEITP